MNSATYGELLRGNKNFRRLWTGQLISELGTWFSFIAELGLVRMFSGSPLATTGLLLSRMLPFLLVAPFAGVFVDRRSRKYILIASDLLRAAVALVYLAAGYFESLWLVFVCAAMESSLTTFFEAAKNAAIPNLVGPREMLTANVMMLSTRFLQFTVGAALGGLTAAHFGYNAAFIVNSLSFVLSAIFIAPVPGEAMRRSAETQVSAQAAAVAVDTVSAASIEIEPSPIVQPQKEQTQDEQLPVEQSQAHFLRDLREGLAYIWQTPFVRGVILVNIGWATGGGMNNLLYDQLGGHTFVGGEGDRGDWGVAALFTAVGAGLFIGLSLARRAGAWAADERRAGQFIGWSLIAHGLFFSLAGLMPSLALMALFLGTSRLIIGMEFGVQETMVMRMLPDDYRGRVFTTDRALELAMTTISMVIGGWMLTRYSPRAMMVASGLLSASPGLIWLIALRLKRFSVPARALR
ncbi:MAG TPA: MFS transporter [Blastocatellia bacterium]|nr:MFS transporter [Blastocatellia bacterium]